MSNFYDVKINTYNLLQLEPMTRIESQVFTFLISNMDKDNTVNLCATQKKCFAEDKNTTVQCVANAIQALKSKGYLSVIGKGFYWVGADIVRKT